MLDVSSGLRILIKLNYVVQNIMKELILYNAITKVIV